MSVFEIFILAGIASIAISNIIIASRVMRGFDDLNDRFKR